MKKTQTIYKQLVDRCLPIIGSFKTDVTKWDKQALAASPGIPFLHFTGKTGTHIVFLTEYSNQQIMNHVIPMVDAMQGCDRSDLVLHFDGLKLHEITMVRAKEIAREQLK